MRSRFPQAYFTERQKAISFAFRTAFQHYRYREEQLVANLAYHLPRAINKIAVPSGYSITVGSVFVHQVPQVTFYGAPKAVELGDILLLQTMVDINSRAKHRALLLQAKKVSLEFSGRLNCKPGEPTQHKLYAEWPRFWYTRATDKLNNKEREVRGVDLYNGAKYLLLPDGKSKGSMLFYSTALTALPSSPVLSGYRFFEEELLAFILGRGGKAYIPPRGPEIGWNKVIQDLLQVSAIRPSKWMSKASDGSASERGSEGIHFFGIPTEFGLLKSFLPVWQADGNEEEPPNVFSYERFNEDGPFGMSTIEIVWQVPYSFEEEGSQSSLGDLYDSYE